MIRLLALRLARLLARLGSDEEHTLVVVCQDCAVANFSAAALTAYRAGLAVGQMRVAPVAPSPVTVGEA